MSNRILVVGFGKAGKSLARSLERTEDCVVGFLDDMREDPKILGTLIQVNEIIKKYKVNNIGIMVKM